MVRGKDGGVSVLVNRCMHRGTMVCAADRGSARTFTCPYHGWTYDISRRITRRAVPRRLRGVRQERARADPGSARVELPRLRLRELELDGDFPRRASRLRHAAHRSLLRSLPGRRDRAHRRLGEASLRRQLEGAARERQRRLSPGLRPSRAVQDRALAVPAGRGRREGDQGGRTRLGQRPHRDRLVAGLPGPLRVAGGRRRIDGHRLRRGAGAAGRSRTRHAGGSSRDRRTRSSSPICFSARPTSRSSSR